MCIRDSRPTVDSALHRLEKRGEIRRVIRGVYDYPQFSKLLDQHLSPDIDQVARALARKFRWRIQPSGATALNFLGLSTQVPARAVYLSDGPDRTYQVGNTALAFEHTALKEAGVKLKESGLIVQALKALGQERITPEVIAKIRAWLPDVYKRQLLRHRSGAVHAVVLPRGVALSAGRSPVAARSIDWLSLIHICDLLGQLHGEGVRAADNQLLGQPQHHQAGRFQHHHLDGREPAESSAYL